MPVSGYIRAKLFTIRVKNSSRDLNYLIIKVELLSLRYRK